MTPTPDRIKQLRKALKLNTAKFGALVGVSGRTVESWEQGLRRPSRSAVILLARVADAPSKKLD